MRLRACVVIVALVASACGGNKTSFDAFSPTDTEGDTGSSSDGTVDASGDALPPGDVTADLLDAVALPEVVDVQAPPDVGMCPMSCTGDTDCAICSSSELPACCIFSVCVQSVASCGPDADRGGCPTDCRGGCPGGEECCPADPPFSCAMCLPVGECF